MGKSQIEAESYDTQLRIETENCTEGGQDVGFIENVDYAVYKNVDSTDFALMKKYLLGA